MKNCVFHELSVISFAERRARRLIFHPQTNVLIGQNSKGKSSILKTMMWAFGAEPRVMHPAWKDLNVAAAITFSVDGQVFRIVRQRRDFTLLDTDGGVRAVERSVTDGIGVRLAEIFDFGLVVADKEDGHEFTPPPAFQLAPYYIDQEGSWVQPWNGFARLSQVRNHRRVLAEYHTGIRPNEYYRSKSALDREQVENRRLIAEQSALMAGRDRLDEQLPYTGFDLDPSHFETEVKELLARANELVAAEESFREKLQEYTEDRHTITLQLAALREEERELRGDYRFLATPEHQRLECPTCGQLHSSSFLDRFEIARDVDRCDDLARVLGDDLRSLDKRMEQLQAQFVATTKERERIEALLATRRGEITLNDLIRAAGRKQARQAFTTELGRYEREVRDSDARVTSLNRTLAAFNQSSRKKEIVADYQRFMLGFLRELGVGGISDTALRDISNIVQETGSELPRTLLAYYYGVLHTIRKHGTFTFFPIVIDEPRQQGLDDINMPAIMRCIFDRRPPDSQVFVGCVTLHGVNPGGSLFEFGEHAGALEADQYEAVRADLQPIIANSFRLESE